MTRKMRLSLHYLLMSLTFLLRALLPFLLDEDAMRLTVTSWRRVEHPAFLWRFSMKAFYGSTQLKTME